MSDLREGLIQVAAVAVACIEDIDYGQAGLDRIDPTLPIPARCKYHRTAV